MERLIINVQINWISENQGGKNNLPINTLYYVITEPIKSKIGETTYWSLVLDIKSNSYDEERNERIGLGKAYFLADNAPDFLLTQGFTLNVYEGPKFVAVVEVL
ncbi:hypothetical protein ACNFJN_04300 [Xenorhabdus budapestensis]|uniref:Uncharacterized protein n=1 Tax=Xenorhabdus budapestensis TaxID=290110 RepID=A0ABX7VJ44_XENBU|nr:hypothetical protein [Xenorhabdus budapestensis]QTL40648.1 hypothetical protein HGO23_04510 [Xenorhabdus budapestensis]